MPVSTIGKDQAMPTRNVVLTEHQDKIVADLVHSGRYQNASEVLREGLRLIEARDAHEQAKLAALQEAARIGVADLEAGRYDQIDDADLNAYIANLGRQASERVRNGRR
jgi:antitoxin ParD1/3/4